MTGMSKCSKCQNEWYENHVESADFRMISNADKSRDKRFLNSKTNFDLKMTSEIDNSALSWA